MEIHVILELRRENNIVRLYRLMRSQSFAFGIQISSDYTEINMQNLFQKTEHFHRNYDNIYMDSIKTESVQWILLVKYQLFKKKVGLFLQCVSFQWSFGHVIRQNNFIGYTITNRITCFLYDYKCFCHFLINYPFHFKYLLWNIFEA